MKVYRDIEGRPELVGECSLEWRRGGFSEEIEHWRRGDVGLIRDLWMTGLVANYDATGVYYSEYVIKLRPEDNPEHLPGWRPICPIGECLTETLTDGTTFRGIPIITTGVVLPRMNAGKSVQIRNHGPTPLKIFGVGQETIVAPGESRTIDTGESPPLTIKEMAHNLAVTIGVEQRYQLAMRYLAEVRHRTEEAFRREALTMHNWRYAAKVATISTTTLKEDDAAAGIVPLPQKPPPDEKPFVPNKFGEH